MFVTSRRLEAIDVTLWTHVDHFVTSTASGRHGVPLWTLGPDLGRDGVPGGAQAPAARSSKIAVTVSGSIGSSSAAPIESSSGHPAASMRLPAAAAS